jgi:adenosylcobinamide-phosphate synthase
MSGSASWLAVLSAALAIDRLVGDPAWLWRRAPHPVALVGRLIGRLDGRFNRGSLPFSEQRRRGVLVVASLVALGAAAGLLLEWALGSIRFGLAIEAVVVAILLAQKSLVDHVSAVARALAAGDVDGGRESVARIVGRDVAALDEAGVARAAIESAVENFSDAVLAPALWYIALGLPGLFVFKIVSTADSMIGHRSPRYVAFGWAAARLDDLLNLVPARLSAALIALAATLTGRHGRAALESAFREASWHRSPNAGWPEAAAAGALGVALGGPRRYGERSVDGAWFNAAGRYGAGAGDVRAALRLIDGAWAILLAASFLIAFLIGR